MRVGRHFWYLIPLGLTGPTLLKQFTELFSGRSMSLLPTPYSLFPTPYSLLPQYASMALAAKAAVPSPPRLSIFSVKRPPPP